MTLSFFETPIQQKMYFSSTFMKTSGKGRELGSYKIKLGWEKVCLSVRLSAHLSALVGDGENKELHADRKDPGQRKRL